MYFDGTYARPDSATLTIIKIISDKLQYYVSMICFAFKIRIMIISPMPKIRTASARSIGESAVISKRVGNSQSAMKVPITIVTQIKVRSAVNGTQLFITAAIVSRINRRYIIVCFCAAGKGRNRATNAIMLVAIRAKGIAFPMAFFKKLP